MWLGKPPVSYVWTTRAQPWSGSSEDGDLREVGKGHSTEAANQVSTEQHRGRTGGSRKHGAPPNPREEKLREEKAEPCMPG